VYLRETRRTNRDGSVVRYLQLAHNERHPDTGVPTAKVIHNFGRVEQVDRAGLARLVSSISRFLDPAAAVAAASGMEVEVLESRRLGGAWALDRVWERLGIGAAIRAAELTPTMKLKRRSIAEKYAAAIERLYADY
jgi:long-subunit acyl-CoA synthetase (AMP-forming)